MAPNFLDVPGDTGRPQLNFSGSEPATVDLAFDPTAWFEPMPWQTGGYRRRDPMFGTQREPAIYFSAECSCGCGHGCDFWRIIGGPPIDMTPPPEPDIYPEPGPPRPEWLLRKSGYFGAAASAWRNSLKIYPRPLPPWEGNPFAFYRM